jgi:hypothetical protein
MSLSKLVKGSLPFTSSQNNKAHQTPYMPVDGSESLRKSSDEGTVRGEEDAFLADDEKLGPEAAPRRSWCTAYWRLAFEVLLLTASFTTMVVTLNPPQKPLKQRQVECGRLLGQWCASVPTPLEFSAILLIAIYNNTVPDAENGVEYHVQRFKGSFGLQSPFTGVGPEVDAAWDNITDGKPAFIPLLACCK